MKPLMHKGHLVVAADPRLLALVPHVQTFNHNGQQLMLLPHALDETKVLRNLGYEVPPPILVNYDWRGTTPFDAQRITAAHITMNPNCFVLNSLGTGKTRAALFAFDYLKRQRQALRMLVVAPLSTLRQTWGREVMTVFPELRVRVLHAANKAKRLRELAEPADIYVINHDGIEVMLKELIDRSDINMLCLDELTAYKEPRTDRWKATYQLARRMDRIVGLTGTPTPNAPTDAYGQVKMVLPAAVKKSFHAFREETMSKITAFKWVAKRDAVEKVHKFMQPSVRFTRDECFDLPPCQVVERAAVMTAEQQKLYKAIAAELASDCARGAVKAVNEADKLNKLVQVALGVVYNTDRDAVQLDCKPRLQLLEELCEGSEAKVIVFTPYKSSLKMIAEVLGKRWSVATVSGDTSPAQREMIFTNFMHGADPHILVAHPACMSHGLTLTAASTIIWYGPPTSLEVYEQANGRITRPGQKYSQLIVNMAATKTEERIYARLNARAQMQGLLLDLFEAQELGELL